MSNFGVFASPDRRLVFDINDFDETLPGPWEWDLKRLTVSMLIAARDNSYGVKDQERIVLTAVGAYRAAMREFAGMGNLAVWYARLDIEGLLAQKASQFKPAKLKPTERLLAKARSRDSMSALSKLTHVIDGQARIVDQSPLIVPVDVLVPDEQRGELLDGLGQLVRTYRHSLASNPIARYCSTAFN